MQQENKEPEKKEKAYTYDDLFRFEANFTTGFGKQIRSWTPSAPKYGFGTADRAKQAKVFQSKEMAKTEFAGKCSPGPNYDITDKYSYDIAPSWKMGMEARNTLNTGPKHDFYLRKDIDFDPLEADKSKRPKDPTVRIGLESRFPNDPKRHKGTPGPQYNPTLRHEIPNSNKFSFGYRRELAGESPLILNASTPNVVGPGSYLQGKTVIGAPKTADNTDEDKKRLTRYNIPHMPKTSKVEKEPEWSFTKGPKFGNFHSGWDKNQTYDYKSKAIGTQANSRKPTLPQYSFGRSTREAKTGAFAGLMATQPTRCKIDHPKI